MKINWLIIFIPFAIAVVSCGKREYTEQGIMEIKNEIDSLLHKPEAEERFDWGSATAYSNFTAYFHNSELIFINEDYRYRRGGNSFNLYYYKNGKLLHYIGRELVYSPRKQTKSISILVDPDDNVIQYEKILGGIRVSLEKEESKEIIKHAKDLKNIVVKRSRLLSKNDQ